MSNPITPNPSHYGFTLIYTHIQIMEYVIPTSTGQFMFRRLALILPMLAFFWGGAALSEELIMFEEDGCVWCARWNRDIGPIYPKSPEGQAAPLRRLDIHDPIPDDVQLARPAFYTPTFVLLRDGVELGRIEGYPGEDFFWGLLGRMLEDNTDYRPAS